MNKGGFQAPLKKAERRSEEFSTPESNLKLCIGKSPTTPKTMPLTQSENNSTVLSGTMIPTKEKLTFKSMKKSAGIMSLQYESQSLQSKSPIRNQKKHPVETTKTERKETLAVHMVPQNFPKSPLCYNREIDEGSPSTKRIKKIQKVNKGAVSYPDKYYTQLFDQVIAQAMSGQDTGEKKSHHKSRGTSKNRKAALKNNDSKMSKKTSDLLPKLSQKSSGNTVHWSTKVSSPHHKSLPPTLRHTFSPPGRSLSQPTVTSKNQMLLNAGALEETVKTKKGPLIPIVLCERIDRKPKPNKPLAGSAFKNHEKMNESFQTPSLNSSQRRSQSELLTPLPSNLTPKSRLSWIESRRDVSLWVQCGKKHCRKWRNLENVKDPLEVPHFWECKMNPDKQFARCDVPEQGPNPLEEEDMIHNLYTSGSLVWARVLGFPWWPAMVCDCPDYDQYYWCNGFSDIPTDYHVVFFDLEKYGVSRAWLKPKAIKPYLGYKDDFRFKLAASGKKLYESRLVAAKKQADTASKLPLVERRKRYSFLARWKGPIKNVKEVLPTKTDLYECDGYHSDDSRDRDRDLEKNALKRRVDKIMLEMDDMLEQALKAKR